MRKTSLVLAMLLAVAGICVMLWPIFTGYKLQADTDAAVQSFLEERKPEQQCPELLAALQEYNRQIYAEKQCNLVDLGACEDHAGLLRCIRCLPCGRRCGVGQHISTHRRRQHQLRYRWAPRLARRGLLQAH